MEKGLRRSERTALEWQAIQSETGTVEMMGSSDVPLSARKVDSPPIKNRFIAELRFRYFFGTILTRKRQHLLAFVDIVGPIHGVSLVSTIHGWYCGVIHWYSLYLSLCELFFGLGWPYRMFPKLNGTKNVLMVEALWLCACGHFDEVTFVWCTLKHLLCVLRGKLIIFSRWIASKVQ